MLKTQQEIVGEGYQALVKALGVVDAVRFIQHFSRGEGNYTQERETWLNQPLGETFLPQLQNTPEDNLSQYDEVV